MARAQTALAIRTLTGVCGSKAAPAAARVSAASALLDRGWGKAPQPHTGEDDKDIRVTIDSRRAAIRIDSLGDLNFMEEPLMVVWTIRRISCWIIGG